MLKVSNSYRLVFLLLLSGLLFMPLPPQADVPELQVTTGDQTRSLGYVEISLDAAGGTGTGYVWALESCVVPGVALRTELPPWWAPGPTAALLGVATTAGSYSCTLRVTDSGSNTATGTFNITIVGIVTTSNWRLPDGSVGVAYSQSVRARAGSGTLTFTLNDGSPFPPGLTLNSDGTITGTPTTAGYWDFGYTVSNGTSAFGTGGGIRISSIGFTTLALPHPVSGVAYNQTIAVTGGTPPYTFTNWCCMPGGLSLSPSTGVISGTTWGEWAGSVQVRVQDSVGNEAFRAFDLTVETSPLTLPMIQTVWLPDITLGEQQMWHIGISGGKPPYSFSIVSGSLPPGMAALAYNNGPWDWPAHGLMIAGASDTVGEYTFAVRVTDSAATPQTAERSYTLRVSPLRNNGVPEALFGVAYDHTFQIVGGLSPYHLTLLEGRLPAGLAMDANGRVTGTPVEGGAGFVGEATDSTEPTAYRLRSGYGISVRATSASNPVGINHDGNLGTAGVGGFWFELQAGGGSGSYYWTVETGSSLPSGLSLANGPAYNAALSGTLSATGSFTFLIRATDAADSTNFDVRQFRLHVTSVGLATNTNLPYANVGSSYSATITATGGTAPITWTVVESGTVLPPGLSLSAAGVISGTPTTPGAYGFNLRATDAAGLYNTWSFYLPVYPAGGTPPLAVSGIGDQTRSLGYVDIGLNATGGTGTGYTWSLDSCAVPGLALYSVLPPWWTPGSASAVLMGVATSTGTYPCTVRVTDSASHTATGTFNVIIVGIVHTSSHQLPDGSVGVAYSQAVTARGGAGTLTFTLDSGSPFPPGLTLNSNGTITGTPSTAGSWNFNYTVSDGTSSLGNWASIRIPALRFLTSAILPNGTAGTPYSQAIEVAGGTPPYTFTNFWGLPGDLTFSSSTGVISGTTGPWTGGLHIRVQDSIGNEAYRTFALSFVAVPLDLPQINVVWLEDATVGAYLDRRIDVTGGQPPYSLSVVSGSLPPGVTILPSDRQPWNWQPGVGIAGASDQIGEYTFTLRVTDSAATPQTAERSYTMRISPLVNIGLPLPEAEFGVAFDRTWLLLGGEPPYQVTLLDGLLPVGLSMNTAGRITGTPLESGGFGFVLEIRDSTSPDAYRFRGNFGMSVRSTTASNPVTINHDGNLGVNGPGGFGREIWAGGGSGSYYWTVEAGSSLPSGVTLANGPSPNGVLSGTIATSGTFAFLIRATDASDPANFAVRQFRVLVTNIWLASNASLPFANVGSSYSTTLVASGGTGTIAWTVEPASLLPPGLSLSAAGVISGTPAAPGAYGFMLRATDGGAGGSGLSNYWWFYLPIYPAGVTPPLFVSVGDQSRSLGYADIGLNATGGTGSYTWSLDSCAVPGIALRTDLPLWWGPGSGSAVLMGVATTPGVYSCTVRVTDSASNTTTATFNITIVGIISTKSAQLPEGSVGVAYSQSVAARGGSGPLTFALNSGESMPPGLTLNSDGTITGTPTQAGEWQFNYSITDGTSTTGNWARIRVSALRFVTTSLPHPVSGAAYSQQIQVTGGTGPYQFTNWCCLPGGISFSSTGLVSGTTGGSWSGSVQVIVRDSLGAEAYRSFDLTVEQAPPTLPMIETVWLPDITLGEQSMWHIQVSGGKPPYTPSIVSGSLPPGMTFAPYDTGPWNWPAHGVRIVGASETSGEYTFALRVTDSSSSPKTAERSYTLRVVPLRNNGIHEAQFGVAFDRTWQVVGGTSPYQVTQLEGRLPAGLTMDAAGRVTGTPLESGNFGVLLESTDSTEPDAYRLRAGNGIYVRPSSAPNPINIQHDGNLGIVGLGNVQFDIWAGGGSESYYWTLEAGSTLPSGLNLSNGPSRPGVLSGSLTATGTFTFFIRATDAADSTNFDVRRFTLHVTNIGLSTDTNLPYANVGTSYSTTLTATGGTGTIAWTLDGGSALPPGLSLSAGGVISGTPTTSGAYAFTLRATDSGTGGSGLYNTWGFYLAVYPAGGVPPLFVNVGDQTRSLGYVEIGLNASGGTGTGYTWTLESCVIPGVALFSDLPPWWAPGPPTAALLGVGTTPGTYPCTVRVTDSGSNSTTGTFNVTIVGIITTTNQDLPIASVGVAYSQAVRARGGAGSLTFTLNSSSSLPPGLTLNADGTITGTPTQAGNWGFGYTISDGTSSIGSGANITVSALRFTTPAVLPNAIAGVPYSQQIGVAGGTGPYEFTHWCCLPGGISMSSTGLISGTTGGDWTGNVHVRVRDTVTGAEREGRFALAVESAPLTLPRFEPLRLDDITLGEQQMRNFSVIGGKPPYTFAIVSGSLPPGMAFLPYENAPWHWPPNGLMISGASESAGEYTFTLRATDSATTPQIAERSYALRVSPLRSNGIPEAQFGVPFDRKWQIVGGIAPYQLTLLEGRLPLGLTMDAAGRVTGTPIESSNFGFLLEARDSTEPEASRLRFGAGMYVRTSPGPGQVDIHHDGNMGVAGPGGFNYHIWAGGGSGSYYWTVETGSTLPAGLTLANGPAPNGVLSGTLTATGTFTFLLRATDASDSTKFAVRQFTLHVTNIGLSTDTSLPYGNVGTSYSTTLTATGGTGTIAWTVEPGNVLPPGLSLSTAGVLSGTPSAPGGYGFVLRATDGGTGGGGLYNSWWFSIDVYPAGGTPPLAVSGVGDQTRPLGYVDIGLNASGGTGIGYTWSLDSCSAPGLALRSDLPLWWAPGSASAVLMGVATTAGTYPCTVRVTDSASHTATATFNITIVGIITTTTNQLPDGAVGVAYSQAVKARGGSGPLTFTLDSGNVLPPGLTLNTDGTITGTPTEAGNWHVNYTVSDGTSSTGNWANIRITVPRFTTPSVLPNPIAGVPYSQQLEVSGGTGPYTFENWCCLPGGLSLSSSGLISGTTGSGGWYGSLQVMVRDSGGAEAYRSFALSVENVALTLPTVDTTWLQDITVGMQQTWHVNVSGGKPPYTFSIVSGSLPPGMAFLPYEKAPWNSQPVGQMIAGASETVGTYTFTVRATDSAATPQTAERTYTVRVSPLWNNGLPEAQLGASFDRSWQVVGGTSPYQAELLEGRLPAGLAMDAAGRVHGTSAESGNFNLTLEFSDATQPQAARLRGYGNVTVRANNSSNPVNINDSGDLGVSRPVSYQRDIWAGGGSGSYYWTVEAGSTLPPGLSLANGPAPNGVLSGTLTTTGTFSFLIRATDAADNTNFAVRQFTLHVTNIRLNNTNTNLPYGNVGTPYSTTVAATGGTGTIAWSVEPGSSLPPGLSLSAAGVISGTPEAPGGYEFRLRAVDGGAGGSGLYNSWWFNLPIYPAGGSPPLVITNGSNFGLLAAGPVKIQLGAGGGTPPYTFGYAPNATQIANFRFQNGQPLPWSNAVAGFLGVATTAGAYSTTIRVTDNAGRTADASLSFTISPLAILNDWNIPEAYPNQAYSYTLKAAGGTSPYTWSVAQNSPPAGISLSATGVLSGTASAGGSCFTAKVADNAAHELTSQICISVPDLRITTSAALPIADVGTPYSVQLEGAGGTPPYQWRVATFNSLPNNLTISESGLISGTMTGEQSGWNWIELHDSAGHSTQRAFSFVARSTTPTSVRFNRSCDPSSGPFAYPINEHHHDFGFGVFGGNPPYTFTIESGSLPAGLWTGSGDGLFRDSVAHLFYITGKPLELGDFTFTLKATDQSGNSATTTCTFSVVPLHMEWRNLPIWGQQLLVGTDYNQPLLVMGGDGSYAWSVTGSQPVPPGLTLSSGGVLAGTPQFTGNRNFYAQVGSSGATLVRPVNIFVGSGTPYTLQFNQGPDLGTISPGNYTRLLTANGSPLASPNYVYAVQTGSSLPPGLSLLTGAALPPNQPEGSTVLGGMINTTGTHTFALTVTDANGNLGVQTFTLRVSGVTISTNWLPNASVGVAYSRPLIAVGGQAPYQWTGENLPTGMSISSGGELAGTPTQAGTYSIRFTVTDNAGASISRNINLVVSTLTITTDTYLPSGAWGVAYSTPLAASGGGGTLSWSITGGSMPSGLGLDPATGVIAGTPNGTGVFSPVISVTDGNSTFTKRFYLFVRANFETLVTITTGPSLPDAWAGVAYSMTLNASGGTPPYTWSSSTLPAGLQLLSGAQLIGNQAIGTTQLAGVIAAPGTYTFTVQVADWTGKTSQREFTLRVTNLGIAQGSLRPATVNTYYEQALTPTAAGTHTFALAGGILPTGLSLSAAGLISGIPIDTGNFSFAVRVTGTNEQYTRGYSIYVYATTAVTLDFGSVTLRDLSMGHSWWWSPWASGGTPPHAWAIEPGSSPPPGMDLVDYEGYPYFGGPPNTEGTFTFQLRATDSTSPANTGIRTYSIVVTPLNLVSNLPPVGRVGTSYTFTYEALNGTAPYTFTIDSSSFPPPGLSLSTGGVLSGTPTIRGSYTFLVRITDAGGKTLARSTTVKTYDAAETLPFLLTANRTGLDDASKDVAYASELNALVRQGTPPYNWSLASGSTLPSGLAVVPGSGDTSAFLSGTPTVTGIFTFTLTAQDSTGQTASVVIDLFIGTLIVAPDTLPPALVNQPYTRTITVSGGTPPYTVRAPFWSSMPVGMSLSSDGVLSGTPTLAGTYTLYFEMTDALNALISKRYVLTVHPPGTELQFADLAVAMTSSPASPVAGSNLTFTATVTNNGPSAASGVTLTDTLPGSMVFVSATPSQGNCTGTTTITCALGTLANAASATVTIVVTPRTGGSLSNTAAVTSDATDNTSSNDSDTETVAVTNPAPTLTGLNPSSAVSGGSGFTLTLAGTGFVTASKVMWGATEKTPATVTATQITVAITAGDIATPGTVAVTVVNPAPGGGTSSAINFSISTVYTAAAIAGTPQSVHLSTAFATNLKVKVTNTSGGTNVAGASVTFTAPASGATGTFSGGVAMVSVITGADGVATAPAFTANNTAGSYTVTASAAGSNVVSFNMTNTNQAPATVSVTPAGSLTMTQTFTGVYADGDGGADIIFSGLLINSTASGTGACYVYYQNQNLWLRNDAGSGGQGAPPGTTRLIANSQCMLDIGQSSVVRSGNNLTMTIALGFTPAFAAAGRNIYLYAGDEHGLNSGWVQRGTWNTNQPPSGASVTPGSGSGTTASFAAVYSDPNGNAQINFTGLLINSTVSAVGACYVYYQNQNLWLRNDAGSGGSGAPPGTVRTVSNSQCTLDIGQSTVVRSGDNVTMTLALTFTPAFSGIKNVYLFAADAGGLNSGWVLRGSWYTGSANLPPAAVSVTPNTGSGASASFAAAYSDPNGNAQISFAGLLINTTATGAGACYVYFQNQYLWLRNDAGSGGAGAPPGTVRTVSNSQCTLDIGQSSVVRSGNNLTMNLALTFTPSFEELKNVYLYAADSGGLNSGWVQRGTWYTGSTNQPPAAVSVAPNSGSGASAVFTALYADPNGNAQITFAGLMIHTQVSGAGACYVYYQNQYLWLRNDAGSGGSGAPPGTGQIVSNSQCSLNIGQSSVVRSGTSLTMNLALAFTPAFEGAKNVYLYTADSGGLNSGWVQRGTWYTGSTNQPPVTVSVSPSSGSGPAVVFTAVYSDPNGASQVSFAGFLMNTVVSGTAACYVYYQNGYLWLRNDAGSGGSGAPPGTARVVSNSQCALNIGQSSVVPSGNNLVVTLSLTFAPTYTGTKNVYMYATDTGGLHTNWDLRGVWTPWP